MLTADPQITSMRENASRALLTAARLCFAAVIILIPVRTRFVVLVRPVLSIPADYTNFLLFGTDIAVLLVLTLWAFSLIIRPRRQNLGPRLIWMPLACLTLAGWISTISSYDTNLSIYHAVRLTGLFWFYVYIVNEISAISWVILPAGIQILIQWIIALVQFVWQHSVGLQSIGELYLDPAQSGASIVIADGVRLLRAYGLTDHPNILGGCLAFGLLLILPSYLLGSSRWPALVILLLGGAALLVTFSRSAWLAFLLASMLLLALDIVRRRRASLKRWLLLGIGWLVLAVPIILIYPHFFGVRLNAGNSFNTPTAEQQSIGERLLLVESALPMIAAHPVVGVGLGAAPLALKAYRPDWPVTFEPPHLSLLDAALETGIPGAAFYLVLILAPFAMFAHRRSLQAHSVSTSAIALLLAVAVVGFFDYYPWMLAPGRLWQWLSWGLWAAACVPGSRLVASCSDSLVNGATLIRNAPTIA